MSAIQEGTILDFAYTGAAQEIVLPFGIYKLECWGAQGGDAKANYAFGGRGGYACGVIKLLRSTRLIVYVGQSGPVPSSNVPSDPAFNGGGHGNLSATTTTYRVTSGGGASDIRVGSDSLYARVIVAGAGGGSGYSSSSQNPDGGVGGGESGGDGAAYQTYTRQGYGGTQVAGGENGYQTADNYGAFGQGGSDVTASHAGAGGGGGWYGGGASDGYYCGGGGGSGFVWVGKNAPEGYLLTEEHYLTETKNIAGSETFTAPDGTEETGHSGDGYVRITAIKLLPDPVTDIVAHMDGETSVALSWPAASGAEQYRVERNGNLLAEITDTKYEDDSLQLFGRYSYRVFPVNGNGVGSGASVLVAAIPANPLLYLITDRTQADVRALQALYAKPKSAWTAEDWNKFLLGNHRGAYNATDMNRVLDALEYLTDRVTKFGYQKPTVKRPSILEGDAVRTYYEIGDCPTASEFAQYLENVSRIRSVLNVPASVPAVQEDIGQRITIEEANNIEIILMAVESLLNRILLSWFYSGEVYSGEV